MIYFTYKLYREVNSETIHTEINLLHITVYANILICILQILLYLHIIKLALIYRYCSKTGGLNLMFKQENDEFLNSCSMSSG